MQTVMYRIVTSDELYHHGIKGQKWGVRRYQNEDGTLTEEGRRRYWREEQRLRNGEKRASLKVEDWVKQDKMTRAIGIGSMLAGDAVRLAAGGAPIVAGLFAVNPIAATGSVAVGLGLDYAIGRAIGNFMINSNDRHIKRSMEFEELETKLKGDEHEDEDEE